MGARIRKAFSIDALVLYAVALAFEWPAVVVRVWIVLLAAMILNGVVGHTVVSLDLCIQLALLPVYWSVFAMITPIGTGWWWKQRLGGREPSSREQMAYTDALDLLQARAVHRLPQPASWFVLDVLHPDAAVCGNALMLSRGLIESEFLPAVLAHELGHLATPDGKLTAALNRLVLWTPQEREERGQHERVHAHGIFLGAMAWIVGKLVALIRGGLGLWLTRPLWGNYWRAREYLADGYAASLGEADELADFLEVHALINDHPVPFIWLSEHTHPSTELRIDRLRGAAVATGSEPVKAAPSEPPSAGPDGPALTEPDPSAERSIRWAGRALPRFRSHH